MTPPEYGSTFFPVDHSSSFIQLHVPRPGQKCQAVPSSILTSTVDNLSAPSLLPGSQWKPVWVYSPYGNLATGSSEDLQNHCR